MVDVDEGHPLAMATLEYLRGDACKPQQSRLDENKWKPEKKEARKKRKKKKKGTKKNAMMSDEGEGDE